MLRLLSNTSAKMVTGRITAVAAEASAVALLGQILPAGPGAEAGGTQQAKDKREVETLATVTGTGVSGAQFEQSTVPLTNAFFVQEAGTTILLVAKIDGTIPPPDPVGCTAGVVVESAPDVLLQDMALESLGVGRNRQTEALIPASVAVPRTLTAKLGDDCPDPAGPDTGQNFTVTLTVTVLALR